ncbi:MAG: hypothetical protein KIT83_17685 [Bryobacterales bacterium]|nr:hypothetical protein [Bryobacterales bacterium]
MDLQLVIYDVEGRTKGSVDLVITYHDKQWAISGDPAGIWPSIGSSSSGKLEVSGSGEVFIADREPGGNPRSVLALTSAPTSDTAIGHVGTGRIVVPTDPSYKDGKVFWKFEMSTVRRRMLSLMRECVPMQEMTSSMPEFKALTGYDTARIKKDFWEKKPNPVTTFTCCNLFLQAMALRCGQAVGKVPGSKLASGTLLLNHVDADVPGCWITPGDGRAPRPGDYYSVPYIKGKQIQQYGHVGLVAKIENGVWTSLDGGQGGFSQKIDKIKWVNRGILDPSKMNGWVDIDIYFGGAEYLQKYLKRQKKK